MVRIIAAYQGLPAYILSARANPQADLQEIWQEHMIAPFWDQWAAGEHNEARTREQISQPIRGLDGLEQEYQALAASGIETLASNAYKHICALLPYHEGESAICIMPADPADHGLIDGMNGVVGTCIGGNTLLTINPAGKDWSSWLKYVLAHERHHSAWGYHYFYIRGGSGQNLLVSLISEGAADSFARQICPDLSPLWIDALSRAEEIRQWHEIEPILRQPDERGELYRRFFFGDNAAGTPNYTGYTIGFHIVQGYIRSHLHASVSEWTLQDPEVIFSESGYAVGQE